MGKKIVGWLLIALCSLILFSPENGTASIGNIKEFLNTCPKNDPVYNQIKNDFTIRRNGVVVPFDGIACTEPTSSMNIAQYTDELIVLQGLRTSYYMDYGQSGHLPWTPGTLYQWMKSKIKGFNIDDAATNNSCCETFPDGVYVTLTKSDDFNRDFDRAWKGIEGNIGLYAHEVRHLDNFPHVNCNGNLNDLNYNPAALTTFGTQWWLEKSWLNGDINVGYSCLSSSERQEITDWALSSLNVFRNRFCNTKPPLVPMPANPGGPCQAAPSLSWKVQTVDAALDFGQYVSTAIDPGNDIPYISYFDATSGHLRLASPVTSPANCGPNNSWWCRTVDSNPKVGKYSSTAISKSGSTWKLGISYLDETNHSLKYAVYTCFGSICGWTFETIDSPLAPPRFTSLTFDSDLLPHIAYQSDCGPSCSSLKYASYVGSGGNCGAGKWRCDTVKNVGYAGYGLYPSLALNGSNRPRIAHYDSFFGNLGYAWDCGSGSCGNCGPGNTWQCDVMDSTGNVGLFPSLHIDKGASDNARIAYYDSTNGKLKYVTIPGTIGNCGPLFFGIRIWQCDVIDNMGASLTGYAGVSLGVDPAGKPLIAYLDASDPQTPTLLKVAQPTSLPGNGNCGPIANWECATVDGGGSWTNEGSFVSLAFNSTGKPIMAYYEEDNYTDGNLKVAALWDYPFPPFLPSAPFLYFLPLILR